MKDSQEIKYILSGLYGVLALVASVLLVLVWRARPTERCRVPLHVLLVVAPLVRLIEQLISFKVYQYIQTNLLWLQVLMDLLPELLFWQAFVMLVLLWVEMYHFSRNKVTDPSIWAKMSLTTVFGIFSFLAYACAGGFAALMEFTNKYDMMAEAIFLTVLTLGAMIVFVHYGYLTHKRMDRVPLFPPHRKTRRLNRMKFTVVSVVICNILHIAYLYVVDVIDKMRDVHTGKYFLWIWMAYFIFTEILPAAAILIVFRKPPRYNKAGRPSSYHPTPHPVGAYTPVPVVPPPSQFSPPFLGAHHGYGTGGSSYGSGYGSPSYGSYGIQDDYAELSPK